MRPREELTVRPTYKLNDLLQKQAGAELGQAQLKLELELSLLNLRFFALN